MYRRALTPLTRSVTRSVLARNGIQQAARFVLPLATTAPRLTSYRFASTEAAKENKEEKPVEGEEPVKELSLIHI